MVSRERVSTGPLTERNACPGPPIIKSRFSPRFRDKSQCIDKVTDIALRRGEDRESEDFAENLVGQAGYGRKSDLTRRCAALYLPPNMPRLGVDGATALVQRVEVAERCEERHLGGISTGGSVIAKGWLITESICRSLYETAQVVESEVDGAENSAWVVRGGYGRAHCDLVRQTLSKTLIDPVKRVA